MDTGTIASPLRTLSRRYHLSSRREGNHVDQQQLRNRTAALTAPTLAITGELNLPDFHGAGDAMVEHITGAKQVVIPGVGHMPNMEDPTTFNKILLEFLYGVA